MSKAAVVGLGTMGPGIAQTLARAGMEVIAFDVSEDQRKKAGDGLTMAGQRAEGAGRAGERHHPGEDRRQP